MTYPASNNNTNGTTAPANANTNAAARTPSARAASKQPAYANTNGQQQQQVNGNGKAPSKPRPPANTNSNNPPPAANGKHGHSKHHHGHHGHGIQQDASKIWNTNSHEERERIKDFWLGLAEPERRDLVKVEKEAVLKKMKEQQKHSCSCAVCGRKRNAIEEELEVLYEAYYEDLEAYANLQQRHNAGGGPPPPGPGPFPGSVALDANGSVIGVQHQQHHAASKRNARRGLPPSQQQPVVNGRGAVMNGKRGPPALTHPPNHAVHEEEYDDDGEVDGDEGEGRR
ncbi:hypothetical protein DL93DRAFT_1569295 [Clavulina sp. PMI_390]|nr:hypothetical protein DL93DRAFT_1569295 [Clavulina sp. PMI_390]